MRRDLAGYFSDPGICPFPDLLEEVEYLIFSGQHSNEALKIMRDRVRGRLDKYQFTGQQQTPAGKRLCDWYAAPRDVKASYDIAKVDKDKLDRFLKLKRKEEALSK